MMLKYVHDRFIFISPEDDCGKIVDAMLEINYNEDFCIANDFSPDFVSRLMEAGFLVMSQDITPPDEEDRYYLLFPKIHLVRSVLLYENLHIKKSIRRFLDKYELCFDAEFDRIVSRCIEKHGDDWLTPPLIGCIKKIRQEFLQQYGTARAYPASFALYRGGKLVAGEFGIVSGNVYTSYSGYYDEDNAGTVQLILAAKYLQEHGFAFFDLGMPMDYKTDLGAVNVSTEEFVRLFRNI